MKYINFKDLGIIIFGDHIKHDAMKALIGKEVISAGTFIAAPEEARCCGESISLGVKSKPEDTAWIKHFIQN